MWPVYLVVLIVAAGCGAVGGFVGVLVGVDYAQRRRLRDLRRKRLSIKRAIERERDTL